LVRGCQTARPHTRRGESLRRKPAKKVAVSVYDETGKQVTTDSYDNGDKAAAGFAPQSSGQYYVSVDLLEGEQSPFCLVYSYK
jgi:hypothetical protein